MEYEIIRSRRKTLCLQLGEAGNVIVRAPQRCPRWYIDSFVQSKEHWILSHQAALQTRQTRRDTFSLSDGYQFSFCGESVTVQIMSGAKPILKDRVLILPEGGMEQCREYVISLLMTNGLPWLQMRLDAWSSRMGISYRTLKLSKARTRWGSCSRDGVIRISIWLLLAPVRAIDYVLVHELSHRRQFDHSPAFWAIVQQAMPDYRDQKQLLRRFQQEPLVQSLAYKGR